MHRAHIRNQRPGHIICGKKLTNNLQAHITPAIRTMIRSEFALAKSSFHAYINGSVNSSNFVNICLDFIDKQLLNKSIDIPLVDLAPSVTNTDNKTLNSFNAAKTFELHITMPECMSVILPTIIQRVERYRKLHQVEVAYDKHLSNINKLIVDYSPAVEDAANNIKATPSNLWKFDEPITLRTVAKFNPQELAKH